MDHTPCAYRISVKAVIKDNIGQILLLQEKDGSWELPGGGLEHSEDIRATLKREVNEETGMTLAKSRPRLLRLHDNTAPYFA